MPAAWAWRLSTSCWRSLPLNRLRTTTKNPGTKITASAVPVTMPPITPVPASYPGAQPAAASASPVSTLAWQDYFTDPRLAKLIETALANNRDLRVAVANIEQARAQFQIQRAAQFPALDVAASGSRSSPNPLQAAEIGRAHV